MNNNDKNQKEETTFMSLPEEYTKDDSYFGILLLPYEKDTTFGKGASKGPVDIINSSKHLEYYDEQLCNEPFTQGIIIHDPPLFSDDPKESMDLIKEKVESISNPFLISLGGDHAVTIGAVRGHEAKHEDFSVLILDAHSDFRYSWNNSLYNHACVTRRLSDKHDIGVIGVRSQDKDEAEECSNSEKMHIIKAYEYSPEKLSALLSKLKKKVYISIDVDVFDPSFMRNTGTPEPGGFFWDQVITLLTEVFKEKEVIGADIVEFAPEGKDKAESFALAKLCYKLMALQTKYK